MPGQFVRPGRPDDAARVPTNRDRRIPKARRFIDEFAQVKSTGGIRDRKSSITGLACHVSPQTTQFVWPPFRRVATFRPIYAGCEIEANRDVGVHWVPGPGCVARRRRAVAGKVAIECNRQPT
jgi:hypothetical protein